MGGKCGIAEETKFHWTYNPKSFTSTRVVGTPAEVLRLLQNGHWRRTREYACERGTHKEKETDTQTETHRERERGRGRETTERVCVRESE